MTGQRFIIKWYGTKHNSGIILESTGKISMFYQHISNDHPDDIINFSLNYKYEDYNEDQYGTDSLSRLKSFYYSLLRNIDIVTEELTFHKIKQDLIVTFQPLESCLDLFTCQECINVRDKIPCHWNKGTCTARLARNSQTCQDMSVVPKNNTVLISEANKKKYYAAKVEKLPRSTSVWVKVSPEDLVSNEDPRFILKFPFPFYGHPIHYVRMMSQGFISIENVHLENLYESQYISPLMTQSPSKRMLFRAEESSACFTWQLNDHGCQFQVILESTGKIQMIYRNCSALPKLLKDLFHPVQIGISDAYEKTQMTSYFPQKQVITYHQLDFSRNFRDLLKTSDIQNTDEIQIQLLPLPTCNQFKNCWECMTHSTEFNCIWCPEIQKCSDDGLDRNFQSWADRQGSSTVESFVYQCDQMKISKSGQKFSESGQISGQLYFCHIHIVKKCHFFVCR